MRVALLSNTTIAMVWFRLPLLRALVARGHQVDVLAPGDDGASAITATGARLHRLRHASGWGHQQRGRYLDPGSDLATLWEVRDRLRTLRSQVLLAYTPKLSVLGALAARSAGVARVHSLWTGLGASHLAGGLGRRALRRAYHISLRLGASRSDSVALLNPDNLHDVVRLGIVPASKAWLLDGEGVDSVRFSPTPLPARPSFLSVGRLVRFKGAEDFVAAARLVRAQLPEARFVLAGGHDAAHPAALPAPLLARWRDQGLVELSGHVPDIRPLLAAARVLVLPSYENEGLPMSILEAMAMGRAVVASDVPGNREAVANELSGLLAPPRSPVALADRMLRLARRPELAQRMGEAGRQRVVQRFAATVVVPRLIARLAL